MKRNSGYWRAVLLATSLATFSSGCGVTGTGSFVDIVWPRMLEEFYRMEGTVCTEPMEVRDETEGIVVGLRFSFAKLEEPCQDKSREVVVIAGHEKSWRKAQELRINQRVVVIGIMEGSEKEIQLANKIVPNRR